jgi:hypothetical protein
LETQQAGASMHLAMQTLFVNPESLRSNTYKQMLEHNRQVITRLIVAIAHTLSDEQHQYFNERIDKYVKLFNELAAEAQPNAGPQCEAC